MSTTTEPYSLPQVPVIHAMPNYEVIEAFYKKYGILPCDDESEAAPLAKREISEVMERVTRTIERLLHQTNTLAVVGDGIGLDSPPEAPYYDFKIEKRNFYDTSSGGIKIYYTFGFYPPSGTE